MSSLADAQARIAGYREPPYGALKFADEQCNFHPDSPWQEQTLKAYCDPKVQRIALLACAGPGKTAVEAVCNLYFLGTQASRGADNGMHHPKGLCTSVTADNLRDNLWSEIAKWQQESEYLRTAFRHTNSSIFAIDHPATWFVSTRAWPKSGTAEEQGRTFSGLHGKNISITVDESGGIPPTVLRAGEQALSTRPDFGKLLQGGNPISLEGMLYEAANRLRDQWLIISINGDPDNPDRSPRIDIDWAREQIAAYGRDNPWVMAYILGLFPPSSINSLLGIDEVQAAMARHLTIDQYNWAQKRLGIDVARFGDDRTVIFPRQGLASFRPIVMRHKRDEPVSVNIADKVMGAKLHWGSELELFDATGGWAAGAIDVMRTNGHTPIDVQFASTKVNDPAYFNRRAEIWFRMAEWVKRGGALPNVPELVAEMTTPTYTFKNGKFLMEEKEHVKLRLGRSPDLADALAVTFGMVDMPAAIRGAMRNARQAHATTEREDEQP